MMNAIYQDNPVLECKNSNNFVFMMKKQNPQLNIE